jgi:4'-phosphopantetheinyl transferase
MNLSFDATMKAGPPASSEIACYTLDDVMRRAVMRSREPSQVSVAVVDVRQWSAWQASASHYLSERDRRQVERLRRSDEQRWRCMGYALLRLWLSCVTGTQPARVVVERDADGRPLLGGGLGDVSLSHAGPWFAFAWAAQGQVGVDLESCDRAAGMEGLEDYVCHPQERPGLMAAGRPDDAGLLRLWTRKEAALKRVGLGLSLEPRTFSAPSALPFFLPGVEGPAEVTEFALEAPVCLAVAHAPGAAAIASWVQP